MSSVFLSREPPIGDPRPDRHLLRNLGFHFFRRFGPAVRPSALFPFETYAMKRTRGFTLVELLVVIATGLLISLLLPALACATECPVHPDGNQVKQIHGSVVLADDETSAQFRPHQPAGRSLHQPPKPVQVLSKPGRKYHYALYSALVAKRAFKRILVSAVKPTHTSNNYNYDAYKPMADTYWDGDVANLPLMLSCRPIPTRTSSKQTCPVAHRNNTAKGEFCNTSYYHMHLIGSQENRMHQCDVNRCFARQPCPNDPNNAANDFK